MKGKGMNIIDLTPEHRAKFKEATKSAEKLVRDQVGDQLVDEFMETVKATK